MVPSEVLVHRIGDMTLFSVGQIKVTRDEEVEFNVERVKGVAKTLIFSL